MTFLYIFFFVLISMLIVWRIAHPEDRSILLYRVVVFWLVMVVIIFAIDGLIPYTGGGDDKGYYLMSKFPINSFLDIFEFSRYDGISEQKGYPVILTLINFFGNESLIVLKFFNLLNLVFVSLIWYQIGSLLISRSYAKRLQLLLMYFFPLWYYVFFLLKDVSVLLLTSLFLLGLIRLLFENKVLKGTLLMVISSIVLITFRAPIIAQNLLVVIVSFLLLRRQVTSKNSLNTLYISFILIIGITFLYFLSSNQLALSVLGIYNSERVLGSEEMLYKLSTHLDGTKYERILFPFIYLFIETSGLSPKTWSKIDAFWLRGLLSIPWILFGVFFFLVGLKKIVYNSQLISIIRNKGNFKLRNSPWLILFIYLVSSFSISFVVEDTTRYRLSDFPIIVAFSLLGYEVLSLNKKNIKFLYSLRFSGSLLFLYLALKLLIG